MPEYLVNSITWITIWPLLLISFITSIVVYFSNKSELPFWTLFAFSMLGIVTGFLTGLSRTAAVGYVLPSVLSLVGGLAIFLIDKDPLKKLVISLLILVFSINLLVGAISGARSRSIAEEQKYSAKYLMREAMVEIKVREFRKKLSLPEWPYTNKKIRKE